MNQTLWEEEELEPPMALAVILQPEKTAHCSLSDDDLATPGEEQSAASLPVSWVTKSPDDPTNNEMKMKSPAV